MAKQIQFRRGTAPEHENFTGAIGEITVDTTNNTLRIHDGATPGGTPLARADSVTDMTGTDYVVAWQSPTADNNYTWYRKYRSGWCEQGGLYISDETMRRTVVLPILMADTNYGVLGCLFGNTNDRVITMSVATTNSITAVIHNLNGGAATGDFSWCVYGFSV